MTKPQFYNKYNSKPIKDGTSFKGQPEVCNQQAAEECEISKLLYQFEAGEINELPVVREAQYNDMFITPQSFDEAQAMIDKVKSDFYSLPVETQRQFKDVKNYVSELHKMALGDTATLNKYTNFSVSPIISEVDSSSSGRSSSSISRGDSEIGLSDIKATNNDSFAGKEL